MQRKEICFSSRLKDLRGDKTQAAIAKELNTNQQTYARWELGDRQPKLQDLARIALHFGVTTDNLLGRETFGNRLRQSREADGLTPEAFVQKLGGLFSVEQVTRIENGIDPPSSEGFIRKCAEGLGTTVEWLRDGKIVSGHSASSGPCPECAKMRAQVERLERIIDKLTK